MAVRVVPHDPQWKMAFEDEARAIRHAFGTLSVQVYHIGSTAIPGIMAKPIIDLLGVVSMLADADAAAPALASLGYEGLGAYGIEGRRYFRKIDSHGTRTHHLHVFEDGSSHVERHLAFRDYLKAHPEIAAEYSTLKERLTRGGMTNWDAYMDAKDPFISRVEAQAVDWFRERTR